MCIPRLRRLSTVRPLKPPTHNANARSSADARGIEQNPSEAIPAPDSETLSATQIEPEPLSGEALDAALADARALQKSSDFNADLIDFEANGTKIVFNNSGQVVEQTVDMGVVNPGGMNFDADMIDFNPGGKTVVHELQNPVDSLMTQRPATLETLNQQLNQGLTQMRGQMERLEADLQHIEHHAKIFSEDHLRHTTAEVIQVAEQGEAAYRRLESQVQELTQRMQRLGEAQINEALGPVREQLDQMRAQLDQVTDRLAAQLPENIRVDLKTMTAMARLRQDMVQVSVALSQSQIDGTAQIDTETFKAALQLSSQRMPSGQLAIDTPAFKALMDVSAHHLNARVEVDTHPLQMVLTAVDGQVSAEVQMAVDTLRVQLQADAQTAQLRVDTEALRIVLDASQGHLSGQASLSLNHLQAQLDANSAGHVQGQLSVNREALQLLLAVDSGQQSAEVQVKMAELEASLAIQSGNVSGRIQVSTEAFEMVLEATAQRQQGRVRVRSEHFEAAVAATSDGAVSGQLQLGNDDLRIVAELAYKQGLAAKLGVEAEHVQIELGTDGRSLEWSVNGQNEALMIGLRGDQRHLAGTLRMGELGVEIGLHDTTVPVPDQVQECLLQMGGQPVQSEMYGLMLSYPLDVF